MDDTDPEIGPGEPEPGSEVPFRVACRRHLARTWVVAGQAPSKMRGTQKQAKREQSLTSRAGTGCLGWMLFGWIFFLLPLLFVVVVEVAILAYAIVVTVVWLVAELAAAISGRHGGK